LYQNDRPMISVAVTNPWETTPNMMKRRIESGRVIFTFSDFVKVLP
jgi:hypothetical protein